MHDMAYPLSDIKSHPVPGVTLHSILVGSEDPPCDPHLWVDDDTALDRDFPEQWKIQALRFRRVRNIHVDFQQYPEAQHLVEAF